MVDKIFINYRRDDSAGSTGRIYERLIQNFDKNDLFMDIDRLSSGENFVEELEKAVNSCDVFIAVIGRVWLSAKFKRRLHRSDDFVRMEIEEALRTFVQQHLEKNLKTATFRRQVSGDL